MMLVAIFLIFLAISAVTWLIGVALYHSFLGDPDPSKHPQFLSCSAATIVVAALASATPYPYSYLFTLLVWWYAAKSIFELPWLRATALFLFLAALSFVAHLALLGALTL